jgi:hypothetical protein
VRPEAVLNFRRLGEEPYDPAHMSSMYTVQSRKYHDFPRPAVEICYTK